MTTVALSLRQLRQARRAFQQNPTVEVAAGIQRLDAYIKRAVKGMKIHTSFGYHWRVDTSLGVWFVPCGDVLTPSWLKEGVGVFLEDSTDLRCYFADILRNYVEPASRTWTHVTVLKGFCARFEDDTGDGTDWDFHVREASVVKQLKRAYGA